MFLLQLIISITLFLHLWISIYYPQFFLSTFLSHYILVIHGPHSLLSHKGESSFSYISPFILQSAMCSIRAINCWGLDEEAVNRNSAIVDRPMNSKLVTVTAKPTLGVSLHNAAELFVSYRSRNQDWVTGVSSQTHSRGLKEDKCYFSWDNGATYLLTAWTSRSRPTNQKVYQLIWTDFRHVILLW